MGISSDATEIEVACLGPFARRAWGQHGKEMGVMGMCPPSLYEGKTKGV